jgi:hypothetical protein
MIAVMIFSFLVGSVLGMRFRVYVLGPASLVAVIVIAVGTMVLAGTGWSALMAMAASFTTLQLGFLGGMTIQCAIADYPAPSKRNFTASRNPVKAHNPSNA